MQILSIFLKLQAVKQSGPGFLAYPVYCSVIWVNNNNNTVLSTEFCEIGRVVFV